MTTRIDMIGLFVTDLHGMVAFYRDVLGFAIDWDQQGPYAEFRHEGVRFSMYERAQLPGAAAQHPLGRSPRRLYSAVLVSGARSATRSSRTT
jgi:lactoylglutathione lyase